MLSYKAQRAVLPRGCMSAARHRRLASTARSFALPARPTAPAAPCSTGLRVLSHPIPRSRSLISTRTLSSSRQVKLASESTSTALQITDPLLIYRAKVANGELEEDEEQLRAMVAFRNLARKLQDYTPPAHLLGILSSQNYSDPSSYTPGPRASGPASAEDMGALTRWLSSQPSSGADLSAMLEKYDIPRGIMLTGPPGTGKSMCMDIFYESLPVRYKLRRHYHHLLLEVYRVIWLEAERRRMLLRGGAPPVPLATSPDSRDAFEQSSSGPQTMIRPEGDVVNLSREAEIGLAKQQETENVQRATVQPQYGTGVFWKRGGEEGKGVGWRRVLKGMPFFRPDSLNPGMGTPENEATGQDLVENSSSPGSITAGALSPHSTLPLHAAAHLFLTHGYIMLFDEVQLVDVASAGILRRVLEAYWRLGGVIVATSNRLPDDLYKNNVQREQLVAFLEVFKERCEGVEMRGSRDFRRQPGGNWLDFFRSPEQEKVDAEPLGETTQGSTNENAFASYFVADQSEAFAQAVDKVLIGRTGEPSYITVYGRRVTVPFSISTSEKGASVARFTFSELCDAPLGPADYLTLASTYRTIILTDVPQLPLVLKNQARRLITFLDAAYEAGTELIVSAAASPDDLFFPDAVRDAKYNPFLDKPTAEAGDHAGESAAGAFLPPQNGNGEADDVVDMSAKGAVSPFLTPKPGQHYPEEEHLEAQKRTKAERKQREMELMSDTLIQSETFSEAMQETEEGFRPNISTYDSTSFGKREPGTVSAAQEKALERAARKQDDPSTFASLAIFSGEDEKFAFQRAVSRLHEMSHPAWTKRKAWRPFLDGEMNLWSGSPVDESRAAALASHANPQGPNTARFHETIPSDFAEEASYEASTYPGRHLSRDAQQEAVNVDSPARASTSTATHTEPIDEGFASGPVGKKKGRDGPPVVSPVHVWGVREDWGPRSGKWGKGTKAFREEEATEDPDQEASGRRARRRRPSADTGA